MISHHDLRLLNRRLFFHCYIPYLSARGRIKAFLLSELRFRSVIVRPTGASQYTEGVVISVLQLPPRKDESDMSLEIACLPATPLGLPQRIVYRASIGGGDEQVTRVWRNRCTFDPTVAGGNSNARPAHLDQVEIGEKRSYQCE